MMTARNNKYYEMTEIENDTFDVIYGHVDDFQSETPANLTVEPVADAHVITLIRRMMGGDAHKFDAAFSVCDAATEVPFNTYLRQQPNRQTMALWHGSRSENWSGHPRSDHAWLSILKTGLGLRPVNTVIRDNVFGNGIYFTDQFSGSVNYTSLTGSVWDNRRQERYLAIYEVHVGNQLNVSEHEDWHMQLDATLLKAKGPYYDSVFGKQGVSLQQNEFVVYNPAQCTVRYVVRIKS